VHVEESPPEHPDPHRNDRDFHPAGQHRRDAGAEPHQPAVAGNPSLGEQAEHSAPAQFAANPQEEAAHRLGPVGRRHLNHPEIPEEKAGRDEVHHLAAHHEPHRPTRHRLDQQHVDQRNVVRNDQHRAGVRKILRPLHPQPDERVAQNTDQQFQRQRRAQQKQQQRQNHCHGDDQKGHGKRGHPMLLQFSQLFPERLQRRAIQVRVILFLLAERTEGDRAVIVAGINDHLVRQRQNPLRQRIVHLLRAAVADAADEQRIPGEQRRIVGEPVADRIAGVAGGGDRLDPAVSEREMPAVRHRPLLPGQRMGRVAHHFGRKIPEHFTETFAMVLVPVGEQDVTGRDFTRLFDRTADLFAVAGRIDQRRVSVFRRDQVGKIVVVPADRQLPDLKHHGLASSRTSESAA